MQFISQLISLFVSFSRPQENSSKTRASDFDFKLIDLSAIIDHF